MICRSTTPSSRLTLPLILLIAVSAFSFGAITRIAWADHYHTNCVPHGFVHGDDTGDGSFYARVFNGCGSATKRCALYTYGSFDGDLTVGGTSDCSAWSFTYGSYTECASTAHVYYAGVFSDHVHKAHNWCG